MVFEASFDGEIPQAQLNYITAEVIGYECGKCGFTPPTSLFHWLTKGNMLEKVNVYTKTI
jgi:hypothetical protein